jgi:predicted nucleic acid-binding protein
MERTIPIFEALIHSDKGDEYHRNYGQLGYALKDSRSPNWERAEAILSKAIQIRGSWQENGWIWYEFNRAICRIMLDDPRQERPSSEEVRRKIVEDLQAVFSTTPFITMAENTPEIMKWIDVNRVTKDEFRAKRR